VKRSALTSGAVRAQLFSAAPSDNDQTVLRFADGDVLAFYIVSGGSIVGNYVTTAVFRDTAAWMHIVATMDTSNATSADRMRLYINGTRVTTFTTSTAPTPNTDSQVNATVSHTIGRYPPSAIEYLSAYLADVYLIDNQALDPSSFGETDATTGVWNPKAYTGTFTGNSFKLTFEDNSSLTTSSNVGIGKDTSGLGNYWVTNNLSVTAGAGNDSLVDVPTNGTASSGGDAGGTTTGNYCTLNPLKIGSAVTLSNGNLDSAGTTTTWNTQTGTIYVSSGKWYAEVLVNASNGSGTRVGVGIASNAVAQGNYLGSDSYGYAYYDLATKYNNASSSSYGAGYGTGDVIGIALDLNAGTLTFYKNGSSQGTAYSSLSGTFTFAVTQYGSGSGSTLNAGARAFAYTAPSGFKALNTANLPAPVVTKPSTVMDVVLYTGTGSSLTLPYASSTPTSIAFTPDLVWIKGRSGATDHALYDAVRDVQKDLVSNSTAAETTQSTGLTAFGTNTFTIGSLAKLNTSSATYAAWCWDAGSSTVTNTQGSITSSVRANATAGFSIVTYTGTGAAATVGHGLGAAPSLVITKRRNLASNWGVFHRSIGATKFLLLNATNAEQTSASTWDNTAPTSTVFSVRDATFTNESASYTYVAYCFAPVAGYSAFGSYTGNGSSTDGPFVYTGFRPRWVMVKRTDTANSWTIIDSARSTFNEAKAYLLAESSQQEFLTISIDFCSNGFKLREGLAWGNASGGTYIYAAFAESPFNYARAR
jgi:SPRY domain